MSHQPIDPVSQPVPEFELPVDVPGTEANGSHESDLDEQDEPAPGLGAKLRDAMRKVPVRSMAEGAARGAKAAGRATARAGRQAALHIPPLAARLGGQLKALAAMAATALAKVLPAAEGLAARLRGAGAPEADPDAVNALLSEAADADSAADGDDLDSPPPSGGSKTRLKLAIAGSVVALAAAPFVVRWRPFGGSKSAAPPLAVASLKDSEKTPNPKSVEEPTAPESTKPATETETSPPAASTDAEPVNLAARGAESNPWDESESTLPALPLEDDDVPALASRELDPGADDELPAIDGKTAVESIPVPTPISVDETLAATAAEPPDPFAGTSTTPTEPPDLLGSASPTAPPAVPAAVEPPALTGLTGLPALASDDPKTPIPAADSGKPAEPDVFDPEPGPGPEPTPAENLALSNLDPQKNSVPEIETTQPAAPPGAAEAPAASLDNPLAVPGGREPVEPEPAPAVAANPEPAAEPAAPVDPAGSPPKHVTSVARGVSANSIRLEAPPAGTGGRAAGAAVAGAAGAGAGAAAASIEIPEPSDPTLFASLDQVRGNARKASTRASAAGSADRDQIVGGRIEPITHIVRRGENFWTIARHYYGSGRFYKALWRANVARVPKIDELYIGTSILVPAPEDLDNRYIEPPTTGSSSNSTGVLGTRGSAGLTANPTAEPAAEPARVAGVPAPRDNDALRTGQDAAPGSIPSLEADSEDLFAGAEAVMKERARRSTAASRGGSTEPSSSAARPQAAKRKRPSDLDEDDSDDRRDGKARVHVVRPYETLRSIAKKELGDSRREDELLNLNRDLVDDPYRLEEGTPLRLPAR